MPDLMMLKWRCGDSNGGFTPIYAIVQPATHDYAAEESLIGAMGSWELADHAVTAHNAAIGAA